MNSQPITRLWNLFLKFWSSFGTIVDIFTNEFIEIGNNSYSIIDLMTVAIGVYIVYAFATWVANLVT